MIISRKLVEREPGVEHVGDGVLFGSPSNPLTVFLDGKIAFGTSFGSTMSVSIGAGGSRLLMLRFGKDTRFVMRGIFLKT